MFIQSTILVAKALIERRGSKVATSKSEGFRDKLEFCCKSRFGQRERIIEIMLVSPYRA